MPIGASRQVGHWTISGCLRDGCRLVHPVRRFIRYIVQFNIYDRFRLMNPIFIIIHIHSVFKYHISIPYSLSYRLFKDILNLCTHFIYSFTYSFIYSFMYSFHMLIHVLISYTHLPRSRMTPWSDICYPP